MPSPFPGMDPFVESQVWEDFHHHFIEGLYTALVPLVRPRYVVRVEERIYVKHEPDERMDLIRPDVTVLESKGGVSETTAAAAVALAPVLLTLPMPERRREAYLTVRHRETLQVVTILEALSPGNKRAGGDGRREYLNKRESVLQSEAHLIEMDLLRGGERLPTVEPLPFADYYAFVCRGQRRPRAEVYAWSLRQPLPPIPVPLTGDDPDRTLDLQAVFDAVYDRAGYDYSLDYRHPVEPSLNDEDAAWVRVLLSLSSP